jgi:hypothetical protein
VYDVLLTRYNSPEIVLELPVESGIGMIVKAAEETRRERLWDMWLSKYPYMTQKTFVSFDDFCGQMTAPVSHSATTSKTKQEILDDAEMIAWSLRSERQVTT